MWKELEGMKLGMPMIKFAPESERLEDVEKHIDAKDKRALAVAAYGGYPLLFLAQGASEVVSFDVDPKKAAWSHFLRSLAFTQDYETNREFLSANRERVFVDFKGVFELVKGHIPAQYRRSVEELGRTFLNRSNSPADRGAEIFPHIRSPQIFEEVKARIQEGGWIIEQSEFTDLLERHISLGREPYDIMYLSNLRNWIINTLLMVTDIDLEARREELAGEFDKTIGYGLSALLQPGGVIYETLIPALRVPRSLPIHAEHYPDIEFQTIDLFDEDPFGSGNVIRIGRKEAT